ncbi:MAG: class I SAM-dependent methyltransferase [Deltaproteobacteria bacterium]|nr:class I SAM-dependent methyltransferase [Deltaproteobacteria bacterium]
MNSDKMDFDKRAAAWDEEPRRVKLVNDIAEAISAEIKLTPQMDVLDFGCGTGLLTILLRPLVNSLTGVDSSTGMLDILKAKIENQHLTRIATRLLDLEQGDTLDGLYHLITSSMTLHHIREIRPLLDQFYKVAAPGGYISLADLDLDGGKFHPDNQGVFHFGFDRATLGRDLEAAGFEQIRDRTAATVLRPTPEGGTRPFTVFLITGRKKS